MAASILINTFAAEFSKFGNFMFDHVRKTMATDPDAELPDVDAMVRLYLQPDAVIHIKKPKAAKKIDAVVSQVSVEAKAPKASGIGKTSKAPCTAITGKGTQCSRCAIQGEVFCSMHLKAVEKKTKTDKKKTRAPPKKKKPEDMPKHTHPIEEVAETGSCDLCESHGNPLDEDDTESTFEIKKTEPEDAADPDPDYILEEEEFDED